MMQANGRGAGARGASLEYYRWAVAGKPVAVHLDFDVVDRLLQEVMQGFGLMPRRSVEVGGLLLGSVEEPGAGEEKWVVSITDFEPIPCRHAQGAGWVLSDEEQLQFEEVLSKWHAEAAKRTFAVGFYRSHTREGLGLTPEDFEMYRRYFPDPWTVALLVKPFATRTSVGAFFLREDDRVQGDASYLEFPFRRRELGGEPRPDSQSEAPAEPAGGLDAAAAESMSRDPRTTAPAAGAEGVSMAAGNTGTSDQVRWGIPVAAAEPRTEGGSGRRARSGRVWIPLSFIFVLFGVLLGILVAPNLRPGAPRAMQSDAFTMRLTAARSSGESVHVRWDRNAPAIQASSRGVLHISDGGNEKVVELDVLQLQNGSVVYRRATGYVQFRLEVFAGERVTVSESVEYRE